MIPSPMDGEVCVCVCVCVWERAGDGEVCVREWAMVWWVRVREIVREGDRRVCVVCDDSVPHNGGATSTSPTMASTVRKPMGYCFVN